MAKTRIELQPVKDILRADTNPKRHDQAFITRSIRGLGFIEPVVLDERTGKLVAGHGRIEALTTMEESGEDIPEGVIVRSGQWVVPVVLGWASTDDEHARAAGIALNRGAELGGWDTRELVDVLGEFSVELLELSGYTATNLDDFIASLQEVTGPPETGTREESTYENWGDNYRNKQVRSMVFDYPVDDYEYVTATAQRAREAYGVESNAELFIAMLRGWDEANPAE